MFTNWVEAQPLTTIEAIEVCQAFFKLVISRHGCPLKVLTDKGKQFVSKLFNKICHQYNIEHLESSAYHHETNGKSERFIQFLEKSLSTIIEPDQSNWDKLVDYVLFLYRSTLNRMLADTPFYLIYGRDAILPQDMFLGSTVKENLRKITNKDLDQFKVQIVKTLHEAYDKLNQKKEKTQKK